MTGSFSIEDFRGRFPDEDSCLLFLFDFKNKSQQLVKCGCNAKFYRVKKRRCFECGKCGFQLYPAKGTIMEGSRTPLKKWFEMIYLLSTSKNGVSAKYLERYIGVTYKCAWLMRQKIRGSLSEQLAQKLCGTVEVDETYIGGRKRAKGVKRIGYNGRENKILVFGMYERRGIVKTQVIENTGEKDLIPIIKQCVQKGSTVYSDEHKPYKRLAGIGYRHDFITHNKYKFKRGDVTTNHIESYWSYIKKIIRGTHVHVSRKWISSYLAEFELRYNLRRCSAEETFGALMEKALNHRGNHSVKRK